MKSTDQVKLVKIKNVKIFSLLCKIFQIYKDIDTFDYSFS